MKTGLGPSSPVTVLTVFQPPTLAVAAEVLTSALDVRTLGRASQGLAEAARRVAAAGALDVVTVLCEGSPYDEILAHAREGRFDLIVMGTHGRTGLEHMLMGSVAEKVVRTAPCPVLTVRAGEARRAAA